MKFGILNVLIAALAVSTSASAAIVNNGSFESGLAGWTQTGSGITPGIGITVLTTGGTNTTGYGDNVPNYEGTQAAFFVDDNAHEDLVQSVSLVGGTSYDLSFALFATASGANNPFSFTLANSVGSNVLSLTNGASTDVPVGVWTSYGYTFTAPADGSYLLNFDFVSGATAAKDVLLDAVNIAESVPEPSTWAMMILGFFGIGFRRYRRKNQISTLRLG
jgi:hypothetical protein